MAFSSPNFHSYDDTLRRMEDMVDAKYQSIIKELKEKNRYMERNMIPPSQTQAKYNPNSLVCQTQDGCISAIDAWSGTTGVMCGSGANTVTAVTKKRDIKSLIAYYYKR